MEVWTTRLVREDGPDFGGLEKIREAKDVGRFAGRLLEDVDREHFLAFYLNATHHVVAYQVVTIGTVDSSLIHPREVFRAAILAGAAAVIVAHNHPSGVLDPSPEDRSVTRQLRAAGKTLGIPLLDSLVVNHRGEWVSIEADS